LKGVSPLIATVLLVAITVVVGGIVAAWFSSFTKTTTEIVGESGEQQLICMNAGILLRNLRYVDSNLVGEIQNSGSVTLGNLKLQILYQNLTQETIPLCSSDGMAVACEGSLTKLVLYPNDRVFFNFSIPNNYDEVRIITNCTNAYDEVSRNELG